MPFRTVSTRPPPPPPTTHHEYRNRSCLFQTNIYLRCPFPYRKVCIYARRRIQWPASLLAGAIITAIWFTYNSARPSRWRLDAQSPSRPSTELRSTNALIHSLCTFHVFQLQLFRCCLTSPNTHTHTTHANTRSLSAGLPGLRCPGFLARFHQAMRQAAALFNPQHYHERISRPTHTSPLCKLVVILRAANRTRGHCKRF